MIGRLLLLGSCLFIVPPLVSACGTADDDDPFDRGETTVNDDDVTEETDPDDRDAWIEFNRTNTPPETSATVQVLVSWFDTQPARRGWPVPDVLDTCAAGIDHPDQYEYPRNQLDAGVTSLVALDGTEIPVDVWDEDAGIWTVDLPAEPWVGEQEYTVRTTGGDDVGPLELTGVIGTPETLALDEFAQYLDSGVYLAWYGANSNSHIELRFQGPPYDEGELEAQVPWVACRLLDDGQHVISWTELQELNGLSIGMELYRSSSVTFDFGEEQVGSATGASIVFQGIEFPVVGGDDDDVADDDDSGR